MFKIYFDQKPVYITSHINAEIKALVDRGKTITADEKAVENFQEITADLNQHEAAVIVTQDPVSSFDELKKQFKVVVAAGGLIYTPTDKFLLIFRKGKWDLPKGKLDPGEDLQDCAVRECEEETGLGYVKVEKPLCVTYHTYREKKAQVLKESHWYQMFSATEQKLVPQIEEDIQECIWVPITNLASYLENAHGSVMDVLKLGVKALHEAKKV